MAPNCPRAGLTGEVGDLILLPRSHDVVVDRGRDGVGAPFGALPLPGAVTVDRLPPGSCVVVHSALLHGRRARPGGEARPRYFSDVSYCQHPLEPGRRHWPSYRESRAACCSHGQIPPPRSRRASGAPDRGYAAAPPAESQHRPDKHAPGGHGAVYRAHLAHGRGATAVARACGIFDLDVFYGPGPPAAVKRPSRLQWCISSARRVRVGAEGA